MDEASELHTTLTKEKSKSTSFGFWVLFIGGAILAIAGMLLLSSFLYRVNKKHLQSNPKILRFNDKGVFTIMQVASLSPSES